MKKINKKPKIVMVSGGFDPVHIGHVRLFKQAAQLGDKLIVVINNDNWLKNKKGFCFMPEKDRKEIIKEFACVDQVFLTKHKPHDKDVSVCNSLKEIKPDIFANGGDRKSGNIPEYDACEKLGIKMVFNVGGKKIRSSSEMTKKAKIKK